jgi:glycosyltransferase involved in cell wall biosynthesis
MKVAMLAHTIPEFGPGASMGIARYARSLSESLRNAGNDVELFIRNDGRPKERWIKTIASPKFSWMPYPLFAQSRMRKVAADVYHSDFITTGAALKWAGRRPFVVSMHDAIPFSEKSSAGSRWYMMCFRAARKADAMILMSRHARKEAVELAGLDAGRAFAVHNGIDHSIFRPLKKKPHSGMRIGYLGGLDGRKNAGLLVDAFKTLSSERDGIELHVAGGGKSLEGFRAMKIKGAFFYGRTPLDAAPEFYNSLDIFVMPSLHEGFGMMTLEAMSCGLPVVGVRRSSTPEIMGNAGVLVGPEAGELVKAISRLADNRRLRERVGAGCLKRSRDFSWEKCAAETLKVYGEVL